MFQTASQKLATPISRLRPTIPKVRLSVSMSKLAAKFLNVPVKLVETVWEGFLTMASENKIPRVLKRIGTHNGVFHCDEALACFMIEQLPEYSDAEVVRTRDESVLSTCDIVVDVGGVYNPGTKRFDHHHRDFNHTFSTILPHIADDKHIKLSSAGLIYVHYGLEVISEILKKENILPTTECLQAIFVAVYEGFVEELDAIDNGVPMYTEGHPKYRINTHLSARVHRLNPEWNSPNSESTDDLFGKAVKLVGSEFADKIVECATVWWPAREIVKKSILSRTKYYESGEVIKLDERCPWKDHLLSLEKEMGIEGELKFVIFKDSSGSWRVQAIPLQPDSFVCRVFLHKDWRGIRDDKLALVSDIEGSIFCHATGFIGGNKTEEGALQMAVKSLQASALSRD